MSQLEQFFAQVTAVVLNEEKPSHFTHHQNVIKPHTERLTKHGDIAFPTQTNAWSHIINQSKDVNTMKIFGDNNDEFARKLIDVSTNWTFPIKKVVFQDFWCDLYLDRPKSFTNVLKTVLNVESHYGQWYKSDDARKSFAVKASVDLNGNSPTEHRCMVLAKVLNNLLVASGFETAPQFDPSSKDVVEVMVTPARKDIQETDRPSDVEQNNNDKNRTQIRIVCGAVRGRSDKTANDYMTERSLEMRKMANACNKKMEYDINQLGAAVFTFDMLKLKHINVIDFEQLVAQTTTAKASAFILYNVARVQQLLNTFDAKVSSGFYEQLSDINDVDFSLLKQEEEWQMFFVYIVGFPSTLERCVAGIENGQVAIHLLCSFLHNLSSLFSTYYHRIKILTENLPQLVPVMFARIYLLKAINLIFRKSLAILEIEPIDKM